MKTEGHPRNYITISSIAVLGFITACVAHEVVGHGGMCLALGRHVTLLTSAYFQCSDGGPLIDAAGPLMNLCVGAFCWGILSHRASLSEHWRLFLVFALAYNLFWGAGYFIFSAVTDRGDWAFVLRDLALQPRWLWRCVMGALGVYLYRRSLRLVAFHLPWGTPLVAPYIAAGIVSCLAALFFTGPALPAVQEAAQESFIAGVGLPFLAYLNTRRVSPRAPAVIIHCSNGWVLTSVLVTVVFFATLGRGFVFVR